MTIKEFRQSKELTLADFARSIGIGFSTLTAYEAGKREVSKKTLAAIKEVYGVDLNSEPSHDKAVKVLIQSRLGGEISLEEILAKVGDVDTVYIKPEDNAVYWVKGDASGAVNLW